MKPPQNLKSNKIFLVLENLRSLYNVGAIFRTAEACQVSKILLVGSSGIIIPESPKDQRQPLLNPKLAKTALGTQNLVFWQHFWTTDEAIKSLPKNPSLIALEQTKKSQNIFQFNFPGNNLALIVGNEVSGVSRASLQKSTAVVNIPMFGKHNSLNVATACGIALYQILNKTLQACDFYLEIR